MVRAVVINKTGTSDILEFKDVKVGLPKKNELLIEHSYISINHSDIHYRRGDYKLDKYPAILGSSAVGVVLEVGEDVEGIEAGDKIVYATGPLGAYAEQRIIHSDFVYNTTGGVQDDVLCASFDKTLVAHFLMKRVFFVLAGNKILINGASGAVGQILCQLAKNAGATVIGSVSSDERAAIARNAGCDHVFVRNGDNMLENVKDYMDGDGIRVAYDFIGGDVFTNSFKCLGPMGLMVSVGEVSGAVPDFNLKQIQDYCLFVTKPNLQVYKNNRYELLLSANAVYEIIKRKEINSLIYEFSFDQIPEAHQEIEDGIIAGSAIVNMRL
jgi:NADPH:quinone reductase